MKLTPSISTSSVARTSYSSTFPSAFRTFFILLLFILLLLLTPLLHAIHDTNQNGVSDLWEKKFNQGTLFTTLDLTADPDGDGWTHAQEAIAGTDPFSANPLTGHIRPTLAGSPTALSLTWPTLPGKKYTLFFSPDLTAPSWTQIGESRTGAGAEIGTGINLGQPDGTSPAAGFWRVTIADQDTDNDNDTLTDFEEHQLGSNALLNDSDSDGMPDAWEVSNGLAPIVNDSALDPDGDDLTNAQEFTLNTSPTLPDTDGDGAPDGYEVNAGSNPNASTSVPPPAPFFAWTSKQLLATQDFRTDEGYTSLYSYLSVGAYEGDVAGTPWWRAYNSTAAIVPATGNSELKSFPYQPLLDTTYHDEISSFAVVKVGRTNPGGGYSPDQLVYSFSKAATSEDITSLNDSFRRFESIGYKLHLENKLTCPNELTCSFLNIHLKALTPPFDWRPNIPFGRILTTDYAVVEADTKVVELTIPKGKKFSLEYELEPPIVETGMCHLVTLLPLDLVLAIPKPLAQVQPPALTVANPSTDQSKLAQARLQSADDIDFATAPSVIIPEDKEDTEGAWAVLNFDDDDEDGGASGHGQANVKGDWEDTNGVEGENDLIYLAIRATGLNDTKFRLKFDNQHIRIYKKSNKTEPITSEETELTVPTDKAYLTLFVEGIKPHGDDKGTLITQQVKIGATGTWNDGDTAKVRVAQPIIAVFEDNPDWADTYPHFNEYAKGLTEGEPSRSRYMLKSVPGNADTFLASGKFFKSGSGELKDVCYSISQIEGEKGERILKIALALQDANVILIGHSNFGLGLAFKGQYTEFTDFFNSAGEGKPAINVTHGFPAHPALSVTTVFTNLAAVDRINSFRWTSAGNRWMTNNPLPNIERYPNAENPVVAPGTAFTVHGDTITQVGSSGQILGSRVLNWHYKPVPGLEGDGPLDKRVILNLPSTDVPTLKYRSLYLNQCNSYRYFLESFHHGTVFATWTCVRPDLHGHEGFITKMLEGADWQAVEVEIERKEKFGDPIGAPQRNRIELSSF